MLSTNSIIQPVKSFYFSCKELKLLLKANDKTDVKVKAAALKVFVTGFYLVSSTLIIATTLAIRVYIPHGWAINTLFLIAILRKNQTLRSATASSLSGLGSSVLATQIFVMPPLAFAVFGLGLGAHHLFYGKLYYNGLEKEMEELNKHDVSNPCFYDQKLQEELEKKESDAFYDPAYHYFSDEDKKLKRVNEGGYLISHFYSAKAIEKIINWAA